MNRHTKTDITFYTDSGWYCSKCNVYGTSEIPPVIHYPWWEKISTYTICFIVFPINYALWRIRDIWKIS